MNGVEDVQRNIERIYARKKAACYAIAQEYALKAIRYFRDQQSQGKYWDNQTGQAMDGMFTQAYVEDEILGWFMAHGVEYGIDLELGNNGRNQAIKPVLDEFREPFLQAIRGVFV